jgi:hypothetical protein
MRRAALIVLGTLAVAIGASAATPQRPLIVTSQDHSLVDADDCDHFHTSNLSSLPSLARSEEERSVPLANVKTLRVRTSHGGGVSIKGWNRPFARLTVCKSAVALSDEQARRALREISVAVKGGEVVANGPASTESQTWWVHMILRVPRNKNLDIAAANGGIAIRNMSATVTARSTNGGISLASCDGSNRLETENGGISLDKITGRVDAVAQNGPISLRLRDLPLPGIEATTTEEGEIVCNLKGCAGTLGDWAPDRKRLRLGGTLPPSIRLTSYSSDIMIEQVR